MTKAEKLEAVKALLIVKPRVTHVYFNADGDYMLHETVGFTEKFSREELLGTPAVSGKKTANDLIKEIEAAETVEAVDLIVGEDTRATVLKAATTKKESLTETK